jgi:hypothetical protein
MRRELRDRRTQRASRQHPNEYTHVLDARNDFFDAHRCDVELRQVDAQVSVALVGADDDGPRLGHGKIGARHAGVGSEEVGPRVLALALGQVMDVAVLGVRADGLGKYLCDVPAELVDRRHDDMARRLVVALLAALAQVGLPDCDAAGLEKWPHVAFAASIDWP